MGAAADVRVYLIASKVTDSVVALGPDPAAVERAVRDLGTSGPWEITAEIAP